MKMFCVIQSFVIVSFVQDSVIIIMSGFFVAAIAFSSLILLTMLLALVYMTRILSFLLLPSFPPT